MLSALLNPSGKPPRIPGTDIPVDSPKERAEALVQEIERANRKIILPTPACAELLTAIGPDAQQYLNIVSKSRVFEVAAFDGRCAAELAILNREVFSIADDKNKAEPYQKRKVDRQIVAICKVAGATEIYTDDKRLAERARLCGITPVSLNECSLPDSARQIPLGLTEHETLPEADDDDEEARPASE
jgi:predicted nucleic acid-binding protein